MERVLKFLDECKTFYVATMEADQPRVRPFGAVCEFEGKLYFITNNKKKVSAQLKANPKTEISGTVEYKWIRLAGTAVFEDNRGAKEAMLEKYPSLKKMYSIDDGIMEVFYLANATANICAVTGESETIVM